VTVVGGDGVVVVEIRGARDVLKRCTQTVAGVGVVRLVRLHLCQTIAVDGEGFGQCFGVRVPIRSAVRSLTFRVLAVRCRARRDKGGGFEYSTPMVAFQMAAAMVEKRDLNQPRWPKSTK
jgi:hypothetical protein